jgi:hypothetical protein
MIAAGPSNKKGGYSPRLSEHEITDSRLLFEQLRAVKSVDLASWSVASIICCLSSFKRAT